MIDFTRKIGKWDDARNLAMRSPVTFTNGCFDILHFGHVSFLQQAKKLTPGLLIVAVNSDRAVRQLKGPSRPLNSEWPRACVLAALESVDFVFICDMERVTEALLALKPAFWAKGADYTLETLDADEVAAAQKVGAEIRLLPIVPDISTSQILQTLALEGK